MAACPVTGSKAGAGGVCPWLCAANCLRAKATLIQQLAGRSLGLTGRLQLHRRLLLPHCRRFRRFRRLRFRRLWCRAIRKEPGAIGLCLVMHADHPDNVTDNDGTDQEDDPIVTTHVKRRLMLPDEWSSGAGPSQAPVIHEPKIEKLRMKLRSGTVVGGKGKGKCKAPM